MSSNKGDFIKKWLEDFLEVDQLPPFEENDQVYDCWLEVISDIENEKRQSEILRSEHVQETKEFQADRTRMESILKDLDLDTNFGLTPKAKRYMKTLSCAAGELGVAVASQPSMVAAVTSLSDDLLQSSISVEKWTERCRVLAERCSEANNFVSKLNEQYETLELQLPSEKKKVESLKKSTKFHSQKKRQYQETISELESRLAEQGFDRSLSHTAIVELGERSREVENQLKPLSLQLSSYHELPADLNLAQVKLHETVQELHRVEDEIHQIFHKMDSET